MLGGGHAGQHVGLGLVHQAGELGDLRPQLVGGTPPLDPDGLGIALQDRGC